MPKERKKAPNATVTMQERDEAADTVNEFDAKYPSKKHMWKDIEGNDFPVLAAEFGIVPVEPRVENGKDVLCAMDRDQYEARPRRQGELSRDRFRAAVGNSSEGYDKPISQFRQPKSPIEIME